MGTPKRVPRIKPPSIEIIEAALDSRSCREAIIAWLRRHQDCTLDSIVDGIGYGNSHVRLTLAQLKTQNVVQPLAAMKRDGASVRRCLVYRLRGDVK